MTEAGTFGGFADLKLHSYYSYRDGLGSVEEQVARAVELGRTAIALTDHATGAGFMELQEAANTAGIKPIFGVDMPLFWPDAVKPVEKIGAWAQESCGSAAERLATNAKTGHCSNLTLLAVDQTGLQNLFALLTWAGTVGYDLNDGDGPRLHEDVLLAHTEGLAVLSGGAGGLLSQLLEAGREDEAVKITQLYRETFGPNFVLEVNAGSSPAALAERTRITRFARDHDLPLLATNDVHYLKPEQAQGRDLLWAIADNVRLNDPHRRKPIGDHQRPLSLAELTKFFNETPDALVNAALLAQRCEAKLPKSGLIIPDFAVPAAYQSENSEQAVSQYLADLARQNLQVRYGPNLPQEMETRLTYELGVIQQAGFSQYILIVADLVRQAKQLGILCAPRGSSAGSLVCFAVGITPLNPLDYGLLFERFLNPNRIAPPDIDLDIADEARPRLLDYVVRHYGAANVALIATHSLEGAKSALRDAGKALGTDPFLVNRLSGLVPIEFQRPWTLARTVEEEPETARLYKNDAAAKALLDAALSVEGTGRNVGTHAAGVVITPRPAAEYVPLLRTQGIGQEYRARLQSAAGAGGEENSGYLAPLAMTQWDMEGVEKRGLLKMDLLGLTAWSTIGHTLNFIRGRTGHDLDVWALPTDDAATYRTIAQGYTLGIFQLEKQGMTEFAMSMKPQNIPDLALLIAAYRPGPMPFLGQIMAVRNGYQTLKAPHPLVVPILAESYGAPVYQETMLKLARDIAGFSLGEADMLRKAIGKKNERELVGLRARFMDGAVAHNLTLAQAGEVWEMFPPFAFYGFNQAHAIIYGYVTYITAYLKVNYPLEYLGALLMVAGGDSEGVAKAASECRRLNVPLLGPDVNHSAAKLSLDKLTDGTPALRLGLAMVKGLGPAGVDAVLAARRAGGAFVGLADFIKRVPGRAVNARTLAALAKVGAFPFAGRAQLEAAIPVAQKAAKAKVFQEPLLEDRPEPPLTQKLADEYQLLGIHLTPVPIIETVTRLTDTGRIDTYTNVIGEGDDGLPKKRNERKTVRLGGAVTGGREVKSMYGQMFSFVLDDGRGLLEISVFPKLYKQYADLLKEGQLLVVEGQIQFNEGRPRLSVSKLEAA